MYQMKEELCERLIMIQQLKIAIKSNMSIPFAELVKSNEPTNDTPAIVR